jgi:hypothetical protein
VPDGLTEVVIDGGYPGHEEVVVGRVDIDESIGLQRVSWHWQRYIKVFSRYLSGFVGDVEPTLY